MSLRIYLIGSLISDSRNNVEQISPLPASEYQGRYGERERETE